MNSLYRLVILVSLSSTGATASRFAVLVSASQQGASAATAAVAATTAPVQASAHFTMFSIGSP